MATIKASGSFVPFTLPLDDDHHVKVSKNLFSLRFNLQIGSMYVEQEMYSMDGDILETILISNKICQDGYVWILGPCSFKVIRFSDSQRQASITLLTNEFSASTVNVPTVNTVKIESSDDDVLVLLDSDEDVCHVVDLSDISHFLYKPRSSNPVLVFVDVDKTPHSSSYMKFVRHSSSFQRPPLHPSSSSLGFNIVDALKMIKSKKMFKSDLTAMNLESIDVRDVKYLPLSLMVMLYSSCLR